jgi:hypothetical protein
VSLSNTLPQNNVEFFIKLKTSSLFVSKNNALKTYNYPIVYRVPLGVMRNASFRNTHSDMIWGACHHEHCSDSKACALTFAITTALSMLDFVVICTGVDGTVVKGIPFKDSFKQRRTASYFLT